MKVCIVLKLQTVHLQLQNWVWPHTKLTQHLVVPKVS